MAHRRTWAVMCNLYMRRQERDDDTTQEAKPELSLENVSALAEVNVLLVLSLVNLASLVLRQVVKE